MKDLFTYITEFVFRGNINKESYKVGDIVYFDGKNLTKTKNNNPVLTCVIGTDDLYQGSKARFMHTFEDDLIMAAALRVDKDNAKSYPGICKDLDNEIKYTHHSETLEDFNGLENTNAIIKICEKNGIKHPNVAPTDIAAFMCRYYYPEIPLLNDKWYLPSTGEMLAIYNNYNEIINAQKGPVSGLIIIKDQFLTSSLCLCGSPMAVTIAMSDGYIRNSSIKSFYYLLPICQL